MQKPEILIAGLGSPHGDDQAGWLVIDQLLERGLSAAVLKKMKAPHDLLDDYEYYSKIFIVDSGRTSEETERTQIYEWPQLPELTSPQWTSHGPGLSDILELAFRLSPDFSATVRVGIVFGSDWAPLSAPSPEVIRGAEHLAKLIWDEVNSIHS